MKRGDVRLIGQLAYFIPIGSSVLIGLFFAETLSAGLAAGAGAHRRRARGWCAGWGFSVE